MNNLLMQEEKECPATEHIESKQEMSGIMWHVSLKQQHLYPRPPTDYIKMAFKQSRAGEVRGVVV